MAEDLSTAAESAAGRPVTVLQPSTGWINLDLPQLLHYRDLLWFLALRDIKVRYKQTLLGALWAIIQPVTMMIVLSVLFGRLANFQDMTAGAPYPIFFYSGMLSWTFFAAAVNAAGNSLVTNASMLRKIYFPRLIFPFAAAGAPLMDFAIAFGVLAALMAWYGIVPGAGLLLLPLLIVLQIVAALGVGVLLAAITVRYRDFRHAVPFMIQVWFFVTPVIYPVTIVPERYHWLVSLNPMAGTVEAFRAATLGTPIEWTGLLTSAAVAVLTLIVALIYFRQVERRFADVI